MVKAAPLAALPTTEWSGMKANARPRLSDIVAAGRIGGPVPPMLCDLAQVPTTILDKAIHGGAAEFFKPSIDDFFGTCEHLAGGSQAGH